QVGAGGHYLSREHLTRLDQQQTAYILLRHHQVAGQIDFVHRIQLTFIDIDGDVNVLLVWCDGHLSRGDVHVDVTTVQVPGTQTLEVAGQLLTGIFVIVADKGQPATALELEQRFQLIIGKYRVAHHVDMLDGGNRALVDLDLQPHAVARLGND